MKVLGIHFCYEDAYISDYEKIYKKFIKEKLNDSYCKYFKFYKKLLGEKKWEDFKKDLEEIFNLTEEKVFTNEKSAKYMFKECIDNFDKNYDGIVMNYLVNKYQKH